MAESQLRGTGGGGFSVVLRTREPKPQLILPLVTGSWLWEAAQEQPPVFYLILNGNESEK